MTTGTRLNDAVVSGMAGAVALTAVHQAARMMSDAAPRMDIVGMRALARGTGAAGMQDESADLDRSTNGTLYNAALAGDLLLNSAYYSLATSWTRGAAMGLIAGVGALLLPQRLGLGEPPHSELLSNKVMTVAWYVVGGLTAAWTAQCLERRRLESSAEFIGV